MFIFDNLIVSYLFKFFSIVFFKLVFYLLGKNIENIIEKIEPIANLINNVLDWVF